MVEAGIPPIQAVIEKKKSEFIKSKCARIDLDEPFNYVNRICSDANTRRARFLERCRNIGNENPIDRTIELVRVRAQGATKLTTYITDMKPTMTVHPVYKTKVSIPDYKRESFTRLRLMYYNLRVEVGRWSRTPLQERVCQCDGIQVQTEKHVLIDCPPSTWCRDKYSMLNYSNIN